MADGQLARPARGAQLPAVPALEEPWRSLGAAYRTLRQRWAAMLAQLDLSFSDYEALNLCAQAPARANELARAIGLTPAGATDVIDRLEHRHLVRRISHPSDRRVVLVRLTPAGARLHREAKATVRTILRSLDAVMTPAERRALVVGLTALIRRLPQDPD